ncbi:replication protein [Candidatus Symbiopectobacterium sp.]|uniref:replication protein n=1 Tax=Candidatus Symbiopectobacterium sp. TaxID=2816440 RepID=UPI0025C41DAC|nr:replication protein [Candidatus Symbiopectobacterium sp.]
MANIAEIINFPVPEEALKESCVAQLEDGFLRLANDLLDATMCSGLPETELCILMAVWRKTYGYSKKLDWISNEQLEAMIDKHHTHCSTAKNNLIRKKVLIQEGRKIGMNTRISEWETKNNGFCKTLAKPAKKETLAEPAKKNLAEVANRPLQKLLTTKDNNTKDKKDSITPIVPKPKKSPPPAYDPLTAELPKWLAADEWHSWVQYRKEIRKAIKSRQTVTQSINTLSRCREMGYSPGEIINRSIGNGWQGLFEPKQPARPQQSKHPSVADNFSTRDYGTTQIPDWAKGLV